MEKKDSREKQELPTKSELQKLTEEEFQKLLRDVKNKKYKSLSALIGKK
jgi:ribosomal protein S25